MARLTNFILLLLLGSWIQQSYSASTSPRSRSSHSGTDFSTSTRRSPQMWFNLNARVQMCGTKLANTIDLLCKQYGGHNTPASYQEEPMATGQKMGLADECCHQPCTWRTLLSYCANFSSQEVQSDQNQGESRDKDEEEIDNRLIEMLYGPATPRAQRRFSSCTQRCKAKCGAHSQNKRDQASGEGNRRSNDIAVLGTVKPELVRPPYVIRGTLHYP